MSQHDSPFRPSLIPADSAAEHRYIHVVGSKVFIDDRPAEEGWTSHFLGMHGDVACWGIDVPHGQDPGYGAETDLYSLFARVTHTEWAVAGRAVQLIEWARTHRFCGACATPTAHVPGERCLRCPVCAEVAYPRISPAMMVLIKRGDSVLLARHANSPTQFFTALAGFLEAGESIEDAVHREVFEEVGLKVRDVSYFGSQPWPFPHSLMIAFTAEYVSGEIIVDENEIAEAHWYGPHDPFPKVPPTGFSIAGHLIAAHLPRATG